jgi:sensor histidine kinase regulating citrate/malate metabolism
MLKNAFEASETCDTITANYMSRDVQHQIFQRSFSTKGPGRGLGLYSMKFFSERYLKGHITFNTSKKKGTTFTASYPLTID